jgi:hypothetical protein
MYGAAFLQQIQSAQRLWRFQDCRIQIDSDTSQEMR